MRRPTRAITVATCVLALSGCAVFSPALLPPRPVDGAPFAPVTSAIAPSVAKVGGTSCSGGGLVGSAFVATNTLVLTAAHVVAGARTVELRFPGREPIAARLIVVDADDDTAVLRVDAGLPPALNLASAPIAVGEPVVMVGYPLIEQVARTTLGRVTASDEAAMLDGRRLRDLLAVDAEAPIGSSGGPVVDSDGTVHGMLSAQITGRGGRDSSRLVSLGIPASRLAERLAASADLPAPTPCT